jgi:hypothetical protein
MLSMMPIIMDVLLLQQHLMDKELYPEALRAKLEFGESQSRHK